MYLDSSVGSWQMSKFMVNSSQGAIANTLNQLYMGKAYKVRFKWVLNTDSCEWADRDTVTLIRLNRAEELAEFTLLSPMGN